MKLLRTEADMVEATSDSGRWPMEPGVEYKVGDKIAMVVYRDWFEIWWDRIRLWRWDVPQTERRWFRCTGTSAGSIWPQDSE